jgi:N-acetylglucosamine-6-phosphate deacetylase
MPQRSVVRNARIVADDDVLEDGWVLIEDGLILELGVGSPPPQDHAVRVVDVEGNWLMPGFIDLHVHGGGGFSFSGGPECAVHVAEFHAQYGTTSLLAGLSTAPWQDMCASVAALVDLPTTETLGSAAGRILGTYLEGPFISATRKGAHEVTQIRPPVEADIWKILAEGRGTVKVVTVAPEVPNGLNAIAWLTAANVAVSIGHTDATGDIFDAAVHAGGTCLTHTFNGMRPATHRDPGVFQVLTAQGVRCELICDGLHVDQVYVRALRQLVGVDQLVLITDAVAWAGQPDGSYQEGGRAVEVRAGRVWLTGTDTLAGSCLTMEAAVRNYADFTGAGPVELARVSATNAAKRLGMDDRLGRIRIGFVADLVTLGPDHSVRAVMRGGEWLREPTP